MKNICRLLILVLMLWTTETLAQVLPGGTTKSVPQSSPNTSTSTNKPAQVIQPLSPSDQKPKFKGFEPAEVQENFDARNLDEKYDNTNRKVLHFKIVEGEIVFDETDKRDIMIFYDNYEVQKGMDGMVRCSIRLYVLNDLTTKISSLGFKLHWPNLSTSVQMNQVNPGVKTYTDMTLLGNGCLNMDKTPTIEVNRCRVKGMSQEECADAIKWFPK